MQLGRRDERRRATVGVVTIGVAAVGIATGGFAVNGRLVADFHHTGRNWVVNCHLEGHGGCPTIGRDRWDRPGDDASVFTATIVGTARHIGRVGRDRVRNRHRGGGGQAVVGDDNGVGERFTRFGHAITIGIAHRLGRREIGRGDDRRRTAIGIITVGRAAVGVATGGLAIDRALVDDLRNTGWDRVINRHLEGNGGCPAIGRNRRNGHTAGDVGHATAVEHSTANHVGAVGGRIVLHQHVFGIGNPIVSHHNAVGQHFARFGHAITVGVAHHFDGGQLGGRDSRGRTAIGGGAVRRAAVGVATRWLAVDGRLVGDHGDAIRDGSIHSHLELDHALAAIGQDGRDGDTTVDIASGNAVDLRAARHIGGVGWRAILYRHIVGAAAAVVRHHDLIGQHLTGFSHTIAIGVGHRLDVAQVDRRDRRRFTGHEIVTGELSVDCTAVGNLLHRGIERVINCHLEAHGSATAIRRDRRDRPFDLVAVAQTTAVGAAIDIGRMRRQRINNGDIGGVGRAIVRHRDLIDKRFTRFGAAIAIATRGGVAHRLHTDQVGCREFGGATGHEIITGRLAVDGTAVDDGRHTGGQRIDNAHLEGQGGEATVGRNRRYRPRDLAAVEAAAVVGAAIDIGCIGWDWVDHHDIGGVGQALISNLDLVGQYFTRFGYAIVVGVRHRFHANQVGGRDDRGITGIDRVVTRRRLVDHRAVSDELHTRGDRVVHRHLEADCRCATVGREGGDRPRQLVAVKAAAVVRAAVDIGRVRRDHVCQQRIDRVGQPVVGDDDLIGQGFSGFGHAITVTTRGGIAHRLDRRELGRWDRSRFTGIDRVGAARFAINGRLVGNHHDASRDRVVDCYLEGDDSHATIGRDHGHVDPRGDLAGVAAVDHGAAHDVRRVGGRIILHQHLLGIAQPVVGHLNLIGQQLTRFGHAVAIRVAHRLN